jgi:hypothetical protein
MNLSARHPHETDLHHALRDALNDNLLNTNFFVWIDVRPTGKSNEFAHMEQIVDAVEDWLSDLDPDAPPPGEGRVQEREIIEPAAEIKLRAIPKKPEARHRRAAQIVGNPEPILVGWEGA